MSEEDVKICITKEDLHDALLDRIRDYYNVYSLRHIEKCFLDNFIKHIFGMDETGLGGNLFFELEQILREKEEA